MIIYHDFGANWVILGLLFNPENSGFWDSGDCNPWLWDHPLHCAACSPVKRRFSSGLGVMKYWNIGLFCYGYATLHSVCCLGAFYMSTNHCGIWVCLVVQSSLYFVRWCARECITFIRWLCFSVDCFMFTDSHCIIFAYCQLSAVYHSWQIQRVEKLV